LSLADAQSADDTALWPAPAFAEVKQGALLRAQREPSPERNEAPDGLDNSERPSALQKSIGRTEPTGQCERKNEPMAAIFQRISYEHRSDGEQSE
jgi:hypothetical protein